MNTPGIIKFSFWRMTYNLNDANYICINLEDERIPNEIKDKSIVINDDIKKVIEYIKEEY